MALEIATAYVTIIPSARNFTKQLRSQIGKLADVKVPVVADPRGFTKTLSGLTAKQPAVKVKVTADTVAAKKAVNSIIGKTIKLDVAANMNPFNKAAKSGAAAAVKEMQAATKAATKAATAKPIKVKVDADTSAAKRSLNAIKKPIDVPVKPETKSFKSHLSAAIGKLPELRVPIGPAVSGFSAKLHSLVGNQSSLGASMGNSAGSTFSSGMLSTASKVAAGIAAIFATQQIIKVGTAAFTEAANFETQRVAFEGILGDVDVATAALDELFEFAKVTPFEFPQLLDAGKKLLAFGFGAERIIPIMTNIGNAAAALGATGTDINYVVRALGQIGSKGRVMLEELNQISEAFPGTKSIKALADAVGVTEAEFTKKLSEPGGALAAYGLTGAQAVEILVESFNTVPGALGAMERQSRTLKGAMTNLKDTMGKFARDMIEPVRVPIIDFLLDKFIPAVTKLSAKLPPLVAKAIDNLRRFKGAFTGELDGVGKPIVGIFAGLGHAVGRFVKIVPDAFKRFTSELDGVGKPVDDLFGQFGHAVGRFVRLLKPIPAAFKKAFDTGKVTDATGIVGFTERIGRAFRDVVDGVKVFAAAFVTGTADASTSGFLGFMSNLGDAARGVYEWLKEKIPQAIDFLNTAIDKARAKLDAWFTFISDHKDAFAVLTGGILGFVAAIKTIHTLGSVAGAIAGVLSLGPLGLLVAAVGALGGAAFLAYEHFQPFRDTVDAVIKAFKEEGFVGAIEEAGKQIGIFADSFDGMWEKVKPKLKTFWIDVQNWFKSKFADLFNFEVVPPDAGMDLVAPAALPTTLSGQEFDFPGAGLVPPPPPPEQFKSFGDAFADAMMNKIIPGVTKWISDNQAKIMGAFNGVVGAFSKWAGENAPEMGKFFATALIAAIKEAIKTNPKLILEFTLALGSGPEAFLDQIDEYTKPGGIIDQKVGAYLKPGGGFDRHVVSYLDRLGRDTVGILDTIGHVTITGLDSVGRFTVGALEAVGRFTVDALDQLGRFAADVAVDVGLAATDIAIAIWDAIMAISWEGIWDGITDAFWAIVRGLVSIWNNTGGKIPGLGGEIELPERPEGKKAVRPKRSVSSGSTFDSGGWGLASGAVFKDRFTGMVDIAETSRARPEILTPVSLMADTFQDVLEGSGMGGRGFAINGDVNIVNPVDATADEVVEAMNAKLGWMLTTRGER